MPSDDDRRRDTGLVGERLAAVEVQTRTLTGEVGKVRDRVHEMATGVGILTGTVEHATETQRVEHQRMQAELTRQDADRAALHQENRQSIGELHGRISGLIWWIIAAQGALIATGVALWAATAKH